jgi:hypothetical protein
MQWCKTSLVFDVAVNGDLLVFVAFSQGCEALGAVKHDYFVE